MPVDAAPRVDAPPDAPQPDAGCIGTPPNPGFSWMPQTVITGTPVTFRPITSGATYAWTLMGGSPATSTDQKPIVTWNVAGTYDVTLRISTAPTACPGINTQQV